MSDPYWPSAPPPTPPVADYPLRPHDVAPAGRAQPPTMLTPIPPGPGAPVPPMVPFDDSPTLSRTAILASVAVVLVIALVATVLSLVRTDDPGEKAAGPTTSTTLNRRQERSTTTPPDPSSGIPGIPGLSIPSGPPASDEEIRAEVEDLKEFVERERGLTFTEEVTVDILDDSAFQARVQSEFQKEVGALEAQGRLLQALGILDPSVDPTEEQLGLVGQGVMGFYMPDTGELVVRGTQITPFWREIVVHELTHALDDQRLELDRPDVRTRTDGSDWPFLALIEGNARRVERAYVEQLSDEELRALLAAVVQMAMGQLGSLGGGGGGSGGAGAGALAAIQMAPYAEGEGFVEELLARGGNDRVTEAFDALPTTAEQVLHPDKYFAGEGAAAVPVPPADAAATGDGVLGEYLTGILLNGDTILADFEAMLLGSLDPTGDPADMVTKIVFAGFEVETPAGWGGDRYVTWEDGDSTCIRVDWAWDSEQDRDAFERALRTWAAKDRRGKVDTTGPDTVRLTRCS